MTPSGVRICNLEFQDVDELRYDEDNPMDERFESLQQQLDSNQKANMLYPEVAATLAIDSRFKTMLQQARSTTISSSELDGLIDFAVRECIRRVLQINQYLVISNVCRERLAGVYRRTWSLLKDTDDVEAVLRMEHYPAVSAWISQLYPASLLKSLIHQPEIRAVTCAEYSAQLQLKILALDVEDLLDPILDIGCGYNAQLVKYLQSCQRDVFGFDRLVEQETPFIQENDWFSYDFSLQSWGTVISHMAFSNHFRYALHHDAKLESKLIVVFQRILEALRPGGCFIVAPGAIELERAVEVEGYRIEVVEIGNGWIVQKFWCL